MLAAINPSALPTRGDQIYGTNMGDMGWGRLSHARGIRGILLTPWSQASSLN